MVDPYNADELDELARLAEGWRTEASPIDSGYVGLMAQRFLATLHPDGYSEPPEPLRCPKCDCCTVEASQRGLCGACRINEDCETCVTMDRSVSGYSEPGERDREAAVRALIEEVRTVIATVPDMGDGDPLQNLEDRLNEYDDALRGASPQPPVPDVRSHTGRVSPCCDYPDSWQHRLGILRYRHANIQIVDPANGAPMRGCAMDREAWPCSAVEAIDLAASLLEVRGASPQPKEPQPGLREALESIRDNAAIPPEYPAHYLVRIVDYDAAMDALAHPASSSGATE